MIKIVDDIKHDTELPSGEIDRRGGSHCNSMGETLVMIQEGLLARPGGRTAGINTCRYGGSRRGSSRYAVNVDS